METEKLQFEVKLRSITHLGRKLYDNLAAAIAELVANSWDAYATEVNIQFQNEKIIFVDNGIGMNFDELANRYCPIGQEKEMKGIRVPTGMQVRPPMGKKGIGKLAAFSIGETYDVITSVHDEPMVRKFSLEYDIMKNIEGNHVVEIEDVQENKDYFLEEDASGFVVEVYNLWKKIDGRTINALKDRISRRFAILSDAYTFNVTINGDVIAFDESYINDKIQYLWIYSNNDQQKKWIENSFRLDDQDYDKKPVQINYIDNATICSGCLEQGDPMKCIASEHFSSSAKIAGDNQIYGWIGTFEKSGDAKTLEGDNLNILQIMFNGKIADEDLLRKIPGKEIAKTYIHGRIHADFIDKLDDPITSSRQGLDDSVTQISQLICYLRRQVRETIKFWGDHRSKAQKESILRKYPDVKNWFDGHTATDADSKRVVNKLFDSIGKIDFIDEAIERTVIKNTILAFEDAKYLGKLFDLQDMLNEDERLESIIMQFNDLSRLEANRYRQILNNRFSVVKKLDEAIEKNKKEKVLHELVHKNMWLVDPYWDDEKDISKSEESLKKAFEETDERLKSKRFDILFRKPHESNYPVLIELKRPNASSYTPTYFKAMEQVEQYRFSAAKFYNQNESASIRPSDIPVIFLWEDNDKFESLDQEVLNQRLRQENCKVIRYSHLIHNVSVQYKEFLEAKNDIEENVGFLMSEDWNL